MNILLIIKDNAGRVLAETILSSGVSTIGRDPACTISVPHRSLSRHHAQITVLDNFVRIVDLGSRNGLHFGGERHQQIEFQENRRIDVGALSLEFQFMDQEFEGVEPEQTSPGARAAVEADFDVRTQVGQAAKSTHESAFLARETFVGASPLAPRPSSPRLNETPVAHRPPPGIPSSSVAQALATPQPVAKTSSPELALGLNVVVQASSPSAQVVTIPQPPSAPVDSPYFSAPVPPAQAVAPLPPLAPPPARTQAGTVTSYTVTSTRPGRENAESSFVSEITSNRPRWDLRSRPTQLIAVGVIMIITFLGLRWGTSNSTSPTPPTTQSVSGSEADHPTTPEPSGQASLTSIATPEVEHPLSEKQQRPPTASETRQPPSQKAPLNAMTSVAGSARPGTESATSGDASYRYGTANEYLRHVQDFINRPR